MHEISCSAERPPNSTATRRFSEARSQAAPAPARRRRAGPRRPRYPRTRGRARRRCLRPAGRPASICRCVVEAACPTSVCVPPRLVATHASSSASQKRCAALHAADHLDGEHPAEPPVAELPAATSCCGWEASPGYQTRSTFGCASRNVASAMRVRRVPIHPQRERHERRAGRATPRTGPSCRRYRARCPASARDPPPMCRPRPRSGRDDRRRTSSPSAARGRTRARPGCRGTATRTCCPPPRARPPRGTGHRAPRDRPPSRSGSRSSPRRRTRRPAARLARRRGRGGPRSRPATPNRGITFVAIE